jgi:hypothetical protein
MPLTTAQKTNLNNSMSAAQDVALGTVIDSVLNAITGSAVGLKVAYGTATPNAASYNVATGLGTVLGVVLTISGSPIATHTSSTAFMSGGSVIIKSWVNSGSVVTAANTSYANVNWIAVGV